MWLQREHFFYLLANIAVLINAYVSDYQNDVDEDYFSYNEDKKEDLHVIHLSRNNHPFYKFEAFGRDINLHLKPNENIVANGFKTYLFDGKNKIEVPYEPRSCFYLHKDNVTTAALNLCDKHKLHGFIFHKNYIFEINPADDIPTESNETSIPHYIKRSFVDEQPWNFDPGFYKYKPIEMQSLTRVKKNIIKRSISSGKRATIEAALFFDAAAYKIFAPYFNYDITQLRDMLLAYINGVQALYHHPSTGNAVDILLMRLEIFQEQPQDLQAYGGEREALLDSFCEYNQKYNPPGDSHPEHWDIGLYVSGLDFYAIEKGKKSGATMGKFLLLISI